MPQQSQKGFDAAVVGGGVIGLACAWEAARRGLRVVLLERGLAGEGTTRHAAGMLAPVSEAEFGRPDQLALGLASARAWPAFAAALADGGEPLVRASGTLVLARDRDAAEALEREHAFRAGQGLGVERLLPSRARALEPALAPSLRLALDVPGDHSADPRRLTAALAAAARRAGVDLREGAHVRAVRHDTTRVQGVELAGGELVPAAAAVIAAGPWSGDFAALPGAPPVRPVKGQHLRLRDPAGPGLVERVLRWESGYLVPRGDGRYVLGATVEERGFDTAPTALGAYELLRDASELVPGVLELELEEHAAGLRPATPDNGPALGPSSLDGLLWAAGHWRNGVLLAPLTAAAIAAWLTGAPVPAEAQGFSPERFARAPAGAAA